MHTADYFSREDFARLAQIEGEPCVSIFLPTHRMGQSTRQDPIRLKNLLTQAQQELSKHMRPTLAADLLAQALALVDDDRYWLYQSDGLALFVTANGMHAWRLPASFEETCVVADAMYLKPLLPLLATDGRFYVLALSENEVRLLQGSRQSVNEVVLADLPSSMNDLLSTDGEGSSLSFHTGAGASSTSGRAAVFHGHGGMDKASEKGLRLKFFGQIDKALRDLLRDQPAPLVLAGVESHFALYREANSFDQLVPEGIPGSPDRTSHEELHERAWAIVEPIFATSRGEAAERYSAFAGTGRTTVDVAEATKAAKEGRCETAFVALGVQVWGSWDEGAHTAQTHETQREGDRDLLNEVAMATIATGGSVFAVPPEDVPGGGTVAAILRY